ncbi:hypothetical protein [Arthrobacter citreus]|uniref:hypothetical protein n=1 Tax=Arthrobacter citreus TaxID=1670 RepID=UPI0036DD27B1
MSVRSEDDVKKALNIESWRNLSKDKLLAFVAEMPHMDREVALKVIEQFPDFRSLVGETMTSMEQRFESAQKFNWKSQKKVHEAFRSYRDSLNRELDRPYLNGEDRFRILEMIRASVEREALKDSENKAFVLKMVSVAATVGVAAVGAAVVALGGKAGIGGGNNRG